jgi:hypothetical protein
MENEREDKSHNLKGGEGDASSNCLSTKLEVRREPYCEPDTVAPLQVRKHLNFADISLAVVGGLTLVFGALLVCTVLLPGYEPGKRDFIQFWATGRQLVHHADPYNLNEVSHLEHGAGLYSKNGGLLMRYPPWALTLVYPLGFLEARAASNLWLLLSLAALIVAIRLIGVLQGAPSSPLQWLGLAFPPSLVCFEMGQISTFVLLGFVLFLYFRSDRPFSAGLALWLCTLKPQLLLPIGVVLVAWILIKRQYRIAAGLGVALFLSNAAVLIMAPNAWQLYFRLMRSPDVQFDFVPCLSDALRFSLNPKAIWIQYVPAALCCVWSLIYFWRRRNTWDWTAGSSPLLLASLLTAPYCWSYDQVLAVPALIRGSCVTRQRWMLTILSLMFVLADFHFVLGIDFFKLRFSSTLNLLDMATWVVWYAAACASAPSAAPRLETVPA